jgi:hypothetical protein
VSLLSETAPHASAVINGSTFFPEEINSNSTCGKCFVRMGTSAPITFGFLIFFKISHAFLYL